MKNCRAYLVLMFLCIILFSNHLFSQVVLTASNVVPSAGSVFSLKEVDSLGLVTFTAPSAGTNQTWDYSAWSTQSRAAYTISFVKPSATPYSAFAMSSTLAAVRSSDTSYTFYSFSGGTLSKTGIATKLTGATVYTNSQKILTVPFSFDSPVQTGSYSFTQALSAALPGGMGGLNVNINASGRDTIIPLATGKLILPGNVTFSSTLCIKRISREVDSIGTLGAITNNQTRYEFYDGVTFFPVLSIAVGAAQGVAGIGGMGGMGMVVGGGRVSTTATIVQSSTMTSVEESTEDAVDLAVFPNPADKWLFVLGNSGSAALHAVTITDAQGRAILEIPETIPANGIDIAALPKGAYFLILTDKHTKRSTTKKFMKE